MKYQQEESTLVDTEDNPPNLNQVLRQYQVCVVGWYFIVVSVFILSSFIHLYSHIFSQRTRFFPTASITIKAAILGYLETGGRAGFYGKFRDIVFRILDFAGVPKKVLIDASLPKV